MSYIVSIHQQSHHLHIQDRVDSELNDVQKFCQVKVLTHLLENYSDEELSEGAMLIQAAGSAEATIHIVVAQVHDVEQTLETKPVIDTKYTIDKVPYVGNCSLCGEKRHDADHCRHKSYVNPDQDNLASLTYFSDEILHEKLQKASEFGFLRGATPDEIRWVCDKRAELRRTRTLLYQHKPPAPYQSNQQRSSSPARSNSPSQYGYARSPSPYERQPSPYERQPS